jgi:tetratricopeptide (TPR) repeat protein
MEGSDIQGKNKMKRNGLFLGFSCLLFFSIISCNAKISPSNTEEKEKIKYDVAAFNWIFVEAVKQKLLGNGGEALKYLEQAVKINPESDASYYQMAQIVSANGNIGDARKFLKKALSLDPQNMWYLMMIGGFYYQERNIDSAIYYYEKVVKNYPEQEDFQLTLGNLYSENKDYDKAVSIYNELDRKYGINEQSTVSAIRAMIISEKWDEALIKTEMLLREFPDEVLYNGLKAEIYRGKGENDRAREVYDRLFKKYPDDPSVQLSICDFLINEKNYTELFLLLNTVIINNNIKKEDKIALFARLIETEDISVNNYDELMISLMVLEANYKEDDIVPLLRPELLIKAGKLGDAAVRLEELIMIYPDNYYAWEKLLLVYNQEKDYTQLMKKGEECASRFNRSFLAKILYANGALESMKYDIALEELRKAEILAGDNKEFMNQILTMRADVYYRMKNYDKAFETFEIAVNSNNSDLTILNNYAYYLAEQNRNLKEAEEMAKRVIETEKGNNTYLDTYAWVLFKRGKLKEAAKIMQEIIDSGQKPDAEWYEHYGYILKKQHNCEKAIDEWNIALKLDTSKTKLLEEIKSCEK